MTTAHATMTCPLCGQPAYLLGGPAPDAHAAQQVAHEQPPVASTPGPPRGLPRCERVERALAARAKAVREAWGRAVEEIIEGDGPSDGENDR